MNHFIRLFQPYGTFILFILPVVVMILIPFFEKFIQKAGALAGLVFSFFYLFLLPLGNASSPAAVAAFPITFILGAFLVSFLQRKFPALDSFWYSLLFFLIVYVLLFVINLVFYRK